MGVIEEQGIFMRRDARQPRPGLDDIFVSTLALHVSAANDKLVI